MCCGMCGIDLPVWTKLQMRIELQGRIELQRW
jgi:hypothetical protein